MTESDATVFRFKQFAVKQDRCAMKVGTDGVLLGAWAVLPDAGRVADIGTGTGLIALMMVQRQPHIVVDGVEIDPAAAQQARENFQNSPFAQRLHAVEADVKQWATNTAVRGQYAAVVSNPPFFSGGTLSFALDRNAVRQTVKLSHGDLLRAVKLLLSPQGTFSLILPKIEALRFEELCASHGLYLRKRTQVRARAGAPIERHLMNFINVSSGLPLLDELIIYQTDSHTYTDDFVSLTQAFYLDF